MMYYGEAEGYKSPEERKRNDSLKKHKATCAKNHSKRKRKVKQKNKKR